MAFRPLVALDVGSTKVACAIGVSSGGQARWELLGCSVVPYPAPMDGWLSDPLTVSRTIEQALEATGVKGIVQEASVAISHPLLESDIVHASVAIADEPVAVRTRDVHRLKAAALDRVLGIDREPLVVELLACEGNGFERIRDPRGLPATRVRGTFHIVTMPMAGRRLVLQAVEAAGLHVAALTYALVAAWSSLGDEAARERVLLIDAGGLVTGIGLMHDGFLQASATVRDGGASLAAGLAKGLGVTMEQATAFTLEGAACPKPEVRSRLETYRQAVRAAIEAVLKDQPRPERVVIGGRWALSDGFAEWVEQTVKVPAALCRSARTQHLGDVSLQVGLSAAIGLLESSLRMPGGAPRVSNRLGRLLEQTKYLLTEYF